ncbi:MAG TPA: nucleotidyl transferase AbiEii/AbiGii toxin family protein [Rhizomicrobium sp.]
MTIDIDFSVLPPAQRALWPELRLLPSGFVLYGGTAVALRLGHRVSVDFDFFATDGFDPFALRHALGVLGEGQILRAEPDTLTLRLDRGGEVKLSCFGGICGRVEQPDTSKDGVVSVASALDLLAHKLKVVLQRAEGRDYQDIAALLRSGIALEQGLGAAATLFAPGFPVQDSAKALTYFDDLSEPWRLKPEDREMLVAAAAEIGTEIPAVPLASRQLHSP